MRITSFKTLLSAVGMTVLLSGCAHKSVPYDYTAFRASNPASILVLPPINHSVDIQASNSVLSQVTHPLGEAGYYVLPVALTNETFRSSGVMTSEDAQNIPPTKLHEIFGADTGLYLTVERYGNSYQVFNSVTVVSIKARLIDLRNGLSIWEGSAISRHNTNDNGGSSPLGSLVSAAVGQIMNSQLDYAHEVAGEASEYLLSPSSINGILPGPRSPAYTAARGQLDKSTQPHK
ncbi:DUF799 domain-containing protein [Saccharibacter floricola]|uniref:DUF799 domain-containing protein n=1 Tax=Saccharibacter floricola TaxID=231053 RepID=UPI00035D2B03|nr:DUF799 domain-containing protein [Saccharibacter floricola]